MSTARTHLVEASVHGRYLVDPPEGPVRRPLLLGFHGYAESAAIQLAHLAAIDAGHEWVRVSVQALHRFYGKGDRVVASWMTREDRDQAIADNVRYAESVRAAVSRDYAVGDWCVMAGFSQGAAQAYRAAVAAGAGCRGVIALGGDLPPEIAARAGDLPPVLIGRGRTDGWYTPAKLAADLAVLRSAHVDVEVCEFDGAHEWATPFVSHAAGWLARQR